MFTLNKLRYRITTVLFLSIIIFYFGTQLLLTPGGVAITDTLYGEVSCEKQWKNLDTSLLSQNGCPNILDLNLEITQVQPDTEKSIKGLLIVYPQGDLGAQTASGGILNQSIDLMFESKESNYVMLKSNQIHGATPVSIPLINAENLNLYPFDSYSGTWFLKVQNASDATNVPVVISASQKVVNGFNIKLDLLDSGEIDSVRKVNLEGVGVLAFNISRDSSDIFMALILLLITIVGVISSAIVTFAILKDRRPPSLGALAWFATFLFALLQTRKEFPGNPPLGILMDVLILFPAMALIMLMIIATAFVWIKRDDWDGKNRSK